jgi:hypothetical protein
MSTSSAESVTPPTSVDGSTPSTVASKSSVFSPSEDEKVLVIRPIYGGPHPDETLEKLPVVGVPHSRFIVMMKAKKGKPAKATFKTDWASKSVMPRVFDAVENFLYEYDAPLGLNDLLKDLGLDDESAVSAVAFSPYGDSVSRHDPIVLRKWINEFQQSPADDKTFSVNMFFTGRFGSSIRSSLATSVSFAFLLGVSSLMP